MTDNNDKVIAGTLKLHFRNLSSTPQTSEWLASVCSGIVDSEIPNVVNLLNVALQGSQAGKKFSSSYQATLNGESFCILVTYLPVAQIHDKAPICKEHFPYGYGAYFFQAAQKVENLYGKVNFLNIVVMSDGADYSVGSQLLPAGPSGDIVLCDVLLNDEEKSTIVKMLSGA